MINISKLLDSVPKNTIQPQPSNLQGILSLIARMSDQRSAPAAPSPFDAFGSGLGAGIAKGSDLAISHMLTKDLQTSAQDFQAGENKLNREFTGTENEKGRDLTREQNALNREQRSIEFAAEQKYRNSRLDLEKRIAQSNEDINWMKIIDDNERLAEQKRVNDAQIALTNAETEIKKAVDPKERNRLESERLNFLLEQAKTEGKTADLKLQEVKENLKQYSPSELEAAKNGNFSGMNPDRAKDLQGLLQSRAQIEALSDKSEKALGDYSSKILATSFTDPSIPADAKVKAYDIYKRQNKLTAMQETDYAASKNQVTNQIRKGVQDLKIDYSKPETLATASNLLQNLDLSSLDAKGKSDLENQIFEKKLIPSIAKWYEGNPGEIPDTKEMATRISLMNQLKMERGSQPLIPVVDDRGAIKSFRAGTPEEFNQWLNEVRNAP